MGYTQEKNLIKYKGKKYHFTFDLNKRIITDGTMPSSINENNVYTKIVLFYLHYPKADGLMEAVIKHYNDCMDLNFSNIRELHFRIKVIKQRWNKFIHLEYNHITDLIQWLDAPDGLTDLEIEFYKYLFIPDKAILTKYAYQYAKYHDILVRYHEWQEDYECIKKVDGKIKLPSNLVDFLSFLQTRAYECRHQEINKKIALQYENHKQYEGETEHFQIIVPSNLDMIKDEAKQQKNCVYRLYSEKIADGETLVVFVRLKNTIQTSYITCEYNQENQNIIQCYRANNRPCTRQELNEISNYLSGVDGTL